MQDNDAKFLELSMLAKQIYLKMKELKRLENNQQGGGTTGDNYKKICALTASIASDLKKQERLDAVARSF